MENKLIAKGTTTDLNLILKLTLLKLMEVREVKLNNNLKLKT
jgi:hypothetical protein